MEERQYYVVQKGDNLFKISSKNKITMQKIKEINGIGPDEAIFPGQRLLLE
ncbi:MAG: LysM domain-containing protein [Desulfobulbaceae bacterium]|nr:MAG: LysM domain-containing protein [Desulfobulbaceae bacterium]